MMDFKLKRIALFFLMSISQSYGQLTYDGLMTINKLLKGTSNTDGLRYATMNDSLQSRGFLVSEQNIGTEIGPGGAKFESISYLDMIPQDGVDTLIIAVTEVSIVGQGPNPSPGYQYTTYLSTDNFEQYLVWKKALRKKPMGLHGFDLFRDTYSTGYVDGSMYLIDLRIVYTETAANLVITRKRTPVKKYELVIKRTTIKKSKTDI